MGERMNVVNAIERLMLFVLLVAFAKTGSATFLALASILILAVFLGRYTEIDEHFKNERLTTSLRIELMQRFENSMLQWL